LKTTSAKQAFHVPYRAAKIQRAADGAAKTSNRHRAMTQWGDVTDRAIKRFESGDQPLPKVWKFALEALAQKGKA
jgi:hypothetical protein